jgi:hypothetical protein
VSIITKLRLIGIQLPEKYKENFKVNLAGLELEILLVFFG